MGAVSLFGALVACFALALAPPALAAKTRVLQRTFGCAGPASESCAVPDPAPLSNPQGIAVDNETGDVYVADAGNNRVEKFGPEGEFLLAFGLNVGGLGVDVCGGLVACEPKSA